MVAERTRAPVFSEVVRMLENQSGTRLPYFGMVSWDLPELECKARDWAWEHRPAGSALRLSLRAPFLVPNEFRPCAGCPDRQHRLCVFAAWAQLWVAHQATQRQQR